MAGVIAHCEYCHQDIMVDSKNVRIRQCLDNERMLTAVFRCTICHGPIVNPLNWMARNLLSEVGVETDYWNLPDELYEAKNGPAFTLDDVNAFKDILLNNDCLAELCGA